MRDQAAIHGALFHAFVIDAAAVVLDFDVNMISTVIGAQRDAADVRLANPAAFFRKFDAVSDGIPDQVHQRIGNLLNDVVVELGFAAGEIEFDLLAGGFRGVANRARQSRIQRADGHHARGGNFVL